MRGGQIMPSPHSFRGLRGVHLAPWSRGNDRAAFGRLLRVATGADPLMVVSISTVRAGCSARHAHTVAPARALEPSTRKRIRRGAELPSTGAKLGRRARVVPEREHRRFGHT